MRLRLKNEKIKNCFALFALACFISVTCLCLLPLTVHADSSNTYRTTMPLYVSPVSGANQGKPADIDLSGMRNALLNYLINDGFYSPSIKYITYEGKSETDPIIYVNAFSNYGSPNVSNYPTLNLNSFTSESNFTFNVTNGVYPMWYNYSTGACGMHTHNNTPFVLNSYISLYYNGATPFYALIPNQFIPGYPLYIENDIIYGNDVVFSDYANIPSDDEPIYSGSSIGGSGTGTFIPSDDGSGGSSEGGSSGIGGTFDFELDLNLDDSAIIGAIEGVGDDIGGSLDDISGSLDDIGGSLDTIEGKIDTSNNWLQRIWTAITDYFTPPTKQEILSAFDDFPLIQDLIDTINTTKTSVNSIFDFSSITPKTANNVDFDYDFNWKVYDPDTSSFVTKTTTIHIIFSWFESVRTPVTLVLSVFLTLGFLVYLFRQIPNLINGVGGGASAGMSVSESFSSSGHTKGSGKK